MLGRLRSAKLIAPERHFHRIRGFQLHFQGIAFVIARVHLIQLKDNPVALYRLFGRAQFSCNPSVVYALGLSCRIFSRLDDARHRICRFVIQFSCLTNSGDGIFGCLLGLLQAGRDSFEVLIYGERI
ncbi:hypothetical protein D3C77_551760 [compost metagenome]